MEEKYIGKIKYYWIRVGQFTYTWGSIIRRGKNHSAVVTKHLSNLLTNQSSDSEELNNITGITVDDSLLESQKLELDTISNDELFNYFQEEKVEIHPNILFPKIKRINVLFWFLHNLGQLDINESNIVVLNNSYFF